MTDESDRSQAPAGMDWDTYFAHRNKLDELRIQQSASFDKSILTLSSGALAFSLVIMENFKDTTAVDEKTLLVISWVFFVLAILSNIGSYVVSAKAAEVEIANMDRRMREQDWSGEDNNFYNEMTRVINATAAISFVVGAIFLLTFAYKSGT